MDIKELRGQYPQYNDLSDTDLADAMHQKYYSDLPKETVYKQLGVQEQTNLLSAKGLTGLAKTVVPSVEAGFMRARHGAQQEALDALQTTLDQLTPGTPEHEAQLQKVLKQQQVVHELAAAAGSIEQGIKEKVPNPSELLQAAMGVVPSLTSMAPGMAAGALNPMAGAAVLGEQGFGMFRGQSYSTLPGEPGDTASPAEKSKYADIAGPMEAITEWIPLGALFRDLGKDAAKVLIAKMLGREIASEEVNTAVDQLAQQQFLTPDRPLNQALDEWASAARITAYQAGMQTAVTAPIMADMNKSAQNTNPIVPTNPITEAPPATPPSTEPVIFTETDAEMVDIEKFVAETEAALDEKKTPPPDDAGGGGLTANDMTLEEQTDYNAYLDATATPPEATPVPPVTNPLVEGLEEQRPDTLMTKEVRDNPDNFSDPNTWQDRATRRVTRVAGEGAATAAVGATFGEMTEDQFDTSNGPVVMQVGEDSDVRPAHYLRAIVDEIYSLAKQFNPKGIYVILPEDAGIVGSEDAGLGYHFKQNGIHYIVPRHLTNMTKEGSHVQKQDVEGAYNANARLQAGSTLWHEFGHSILEDFLLSGASAQQEALLRQALENGNVPEALLEGLAPQAAALIRRWVALRQQLLSGEISGHEAAARFMSPAKLANGTLMQQQLTGTERKAGASKGTKNRVASKPFPASKVSRALRRSESLNFWEFAAEQMAKYQMEEGRLEQSGLVKALFPDDLGPNSLESALAKFFKPVMDVMQQIFNTLKARGFVRAEAEFTDWLNMLAGGTTDVKAGKPIKGKKKAKAKKAVPTPVETEQEIDWESKGVQDTLKASLNSLWKSGLLEREDQLYKDLQQLLKDGQFEEFVDAIEPLLEKKIKFDVVGTKARLPKGPLVKAKKLHRAGATKEQTIRATGWWLGDDGKWRYEISAMDARVLKWPKFDVNSQIAFKRLPEFLHHPKLYELYPQLRDVEVYGSTFLRMGNASYSSKYNSIALGAQPADQRGMNSSLMLILHEVQHAIQNIEGFAPGGAPEQFLPPLHEDQRKWLQESLRTYTQSPAGRLLFAKMAIAMRKLHPEARDVDTTELGDFFLEPQMNEYLVAKRLGDMNIKLGFSEYVKLIEAAYPSAQEEMARNRALFHLRLAMEMKNVRRQSKEAMGKYWRLLGEYEARATAERYYFDEGMLRDIPMTIPDDFIIDYYTQNFKPSGQTRDLKGTAASTFGGEPLVVLHGDRMRINVDGREIYLSTPNILDANWLASLPRKTSQEGMLLPYKVSMFAPLVHEANGELTAGMVQGLVRQAITAGNDGVVIKNALGYQGPVYVTLNKGDMIPAPTEMPKRSQIRFDRTTTEGDQTASIWEMVKEKLSLPNIGMSLHKVFRLQFATLQMQHLAHVHPDWIGLKLWEEYRLRFYRKIAQLHSVADAVTRQLHWLSKEHVKMLYNLTLQEYKGLKHWTELVPGEKPGYWMHQPTAKLFEEMRKLGLDPDSAAGKHFLQLYLDAKNALQYQQDEMMRVMLVLAKRKYAKNPEQQAAKLKEIVQTFRVLRETPFWPQQTFGKKLVQVWETDEQGRKQLVFEAASDSDAEIEKLAAKAKSRFPNGVLKRIERNVEQAILMRLPVEFLDDVATAMGLDMESEEDRNKVEELRDLMQTLYSSTPMNTYDPSKAIVEGRSTDFIRNFADFSLRNSNFIAKMEFRKYFDSASSMMRSDIDALPFGNLRGDKTAAVKFMDESVAYMMNPTEEMHQIRGIVALTYLWANVKTAMLNLWGLMQTWMYLNRELGYLEGAVVFVKGVAGSVRTLGHEGGTLITHIMQGAAKQAYTSLTDPNWQMVDGKPTELRQALEQAKRENVLDQSYAYYLAGQAMRGDMMRATMRNPVGKGWKAIVDTGMVPFRVTELAIRRGTFISIYSALQEKRPNLTPEQRYEETVRVVSLLQGDYTKGNKPKIMRGNMLSLITLFMTYVHNAAWGGYGGIEMGLRRQEAMDGRASPRFYRSYTTQMMLLYLAAAGLEGLPFAENILDLVDMVWRKISGTGKTARDQLREVLLEQLEDSEAVMRAMRGLTFDVAGVDVSRSIGLGRIVPGTDVLADSSKNSRDFMGDFVASTTGIAGGYASWALDTGIGMKKLEAGMPLPVFLGQQAGKLPGGFGNMMKAAQWAQVDARGPAGGLLALDSATGKAREITQSEITLKALGFQPSSVSRSQAATAAKNDVAVYWTERRKMLLQNLYYTQYVMNDREAIADVRRAVAQYNLDAPDNSLKISEATIKRSMKMREKAMQAAQELTPQQKFLQNVTEDALAPYGVE